jgi:hypothetical protein
MLVSARTRWDSMLAIAHIRDVTLNWLMHTGYDHMFASARTHDVTICWLVHAGQDINIG